MEKVFALGAGYRLPILKFVTADGTIISFLSIFLRLLVDFISNLVEQRCHFFFNQCFRACLLSELQNLILKVHHITLASSVPNSKADYDENQGEAETIEGVPCRGVFIKIVSSIQSMLCCIKTRWLICLHEW